MGYTSGNPCMFSFEMKQTPETIRKVLDIAGWDIYEAAMATDISARWIERSCKGDFQLPDAEWRTLLEKAGSRAFDHDEDAS